MALSQQKFREILFQMLFSQDFSSLEEEEIVGFMMQQLSVTKKTMREVQEKHQKILANLEEIDSLITRFSMSYQFDRIARVEKNILRLGVYEICYGEDVPPKVAISEAIRLTRKFSTAESSSFVNAVLDAIFQDRSPTTLSEKMNESFAPLPV